MTGWLADFFRLAGGLLYWNTRKSWFRLRRGHVRCPCQSPSDSGRALETHCEACVHWASAARFRRVCPLLVQTPKGWRCSANTADVRPFWGRAFGYYGGTFAALYFAAAIGVFGFLRVVGYPVSIVHVVWPGSWHRVGEARGWYFMEQAKRAFAANRTAEAILYLSNAYEFDPANYTAGITLAQTLQSGQPDASNRLYNRLLHEHPSLHAHTAQEWFRALLARGDFATIQSLARDEVIAGGPNASVWMRALIFATRQTHQDAPLRTLLESKAAPAVEWRPVLEVELLILNGRSAEAHPVLVRSIWRRLPPYAVYYQVEELVQFGDVAAALDQLERNGTALDGEARVALLLSAYAKQGDRASLQLLVDRLLAQKLSLPVLKVLATQLIRYPDRALLDQVYARFRSDKLALTTENAGTIFALLCAAGVNGDWKTFGELRASITGQVASSDVFLASVEAFFRGRSTTTRVTSLLPALPLPLELNYALISRYPGLPSKPAARQP